MTYPKLNSGRFRVEHRGVTYEFASWQIAPTRSEWRALVDGDLIAVYWNSKHTMYRADINGSRLDQQFRSGKNAARAAIKKALGR